MDYPYPVVTLEVRGMKHAIQTALMAYEHRLSDEINAAVEAACSPENVQKIIETTVSREVSNCIKESVEDFFNYTGEGRKIIAEAVKKRLLEKTYY